MARIRFPKERQDALLEWARRIIYDAKKKAGPDSIASLHDGAFFSELLEIFDDEYNPSELQQNLAQPTQGRRRNLHIIHLALRKFVGRTLDIVEPLINDIDFQALEKEPAPEGLCQILTVLLVVSVNLSGNEVSRKILMDMQHSPEDKKTVDRLTKVMADANNAIDQVSTSDSHEHEQSVASTSASADDELAREAELARLHRKNDELLRQSADLKTRYDRLRENHDDLLQQHQTLRDERDELEKLVEASANSSRLQKELKEKMALIDNLELQLEDVKQERDKLATQLQRVLEEKERLAPLYEENKDLKLENEELTKKANMAEHLKQKLEHTRGLENELKRLRDQKNELYQIQEQLQNMQKKNLQLIAENNEYARKMGTYEIQEAEFADQKRMWSSETLMMRQTIKELEDRSRHDEEVVKDLQTKVLTLDPSSTIDTTIVAQPEVSLQEELRDTDVSLRDLEVSRLQAEISLLKSSIGTETEKGQLVQEIEKERNAKMALQDQYNELFEKYSVERSSLTAMIDNLEGEGGEAFSNLRKQVLAEENNSKHLARQLEEAQRQLKDKDRELLEARGDSKLIYVTYCERFLGDADDERVAALQKDGEGMLAELKHTDSLLALSLRAELDTLRTKNDKLKADFDQTQGQLVAAFIDREQLRKDLAAANTELQKAASGQIVNADMLKTNEKMSKLRERYKKLSEQLDKTEQNRHELEKTVKSLRAEADSDAQRKKQEQIIKNLQRENAMIATAWYDLTSRLQSNHVVLQRRNDAPRSWVNKQRQMINATPRR